MQAFVIIIFNKEIKCSNQLIEHLIKAHYQKQAVQLTQFRVAISETDLDQTLDEWIEIMKDCEKKRQFKIV